MTTAILHAEVQRSRFAQHLAAFFIGLISPSAHSASESAALEAQKVRSLASSCAKTDPGFAADLYAAAERHEGLHAE